MATVFALGSNGSGQLGIGHKEDVSVPKPVLWTDDPPETITAVAAGGNHTLLLGGDGDVYCAGDPASGACGFVSPSQQSSQPGFRKMIVGRPGAAAQKQRPIQMVAATWEASILTELDEDGKNTKIFSCGIGEKGELGQGPLIVRDPYATALQDFPPAGTEITDLAACMSHVVVVLSNGDVYGWGNGRNGQLGSPNATVFSPRKIEGIEFPVTRAVCGKNFTCLLGGKESGQMLVLGLDKWNIKSKAPSKVPVWKDVRAGWSNLFILTDNGDVLVWGRDDYTLNVPPSPQKTIKIAVGSEHALALLETGDVLAWGWGEHGNCGPAKREEAAKGQRNIVASSKFLPPGSCIAAIGAGCATSWIVIGST